jgi:hypothetical protein
LNCIKTCGAPGVFLTGFLRGVEANLTQMRYQIL